MCFLGFRRFSSVSWCCSGDFFDFEPFLVRLLGDGLSFLGAFGHILSFLRGFLLFCFFLIRGIGGLFMCFFSRLVFLATPRKWDASFSHCSLGWRSRSL